MESFILSIPAHFSDLKDPRIDRQKQDILVIAICAILCSADNWVEIERFGRAKEAWFIKLLGLKHGIPSHDNFGKVLLLWMPTNLNSVLSNGCKA